MSRLLTCIVHSTVRVPIMHAIRLGLVSFSAAWVSLGGVKFNHNPC